MMHKADTINIFLAHTPLQNFIASKIVAQYFTDANYRNVIYTSVLMEANTNFTKCNYIDKKGFFDRIAKTYTAKTEITKSIKSKKCNLFICHTGTILDNYFFYSFPLAKYGATINFYYEGILYFYEYRAPFNRKIHLTRKLFGYLAGFSYKINPVIFPANDPRIHKIYSILPEFTLGPKEKLKGVSLLKEGYSSDKNRVLILGGKPTILSNEEVIALYGLMIAKVKEMNHPKVYFKGHHADTTDNFTKANQGRLEIHDITQNRPVEEVMEQYRPHLILSYPSSGLVNLKAMYGDKIEVFSYFSEDKKYTLTRLWPIFENLQINSKFI